MSTRQRKKAGMTEKEWAKHCRERNRNRVSAAQDTLSAYKTIKDPGADPRDRIEQTDIVDLLTDLRHYAKANGLSYDDADRSAFNHFETETHGEE